jgi:hypothetical protein
MRIEGSFDVPAAIEHVYRELRDVGLMARCIPGCESIEPEAEGRYRARVSVGVGQIVAAFHLTVEVMHEKAPTLVVSRTRGEEGSRASMLAADNEVRLFDLAPDATRVQYTSDVSVTGRLGKFALGVMKKKVEALGQEFAQRFRAELRARTAAARSADRPT